MVIERLLLPGKKVTVTSPFSYSIQRLVSLWLVTGSI